MTINHASITEPDKLHEPKGADTANSGEIYIADGNKSGSFQVDYREIRQRVVGETGTASTTLFIPFNYGARLINVYAIVAEPPSSGTFTIDFNNSSSTTLASVSMTSSDNVDDVKSDTFGPDVVLSNDYMELVCSSTSVSGSPSFRFTLLYARP